MPRKILFVSNTANFSKFNRPFMCWFKQQGWRVDYVSAGEETVLDCDNQYAISLVRNPFNFKNFRAYKELKKILTNDYNIIHCHTPMGGFLARLAARKGKAKVIYTAHGFHFYKGAPLLNWLIYYPIEKFLMRYTDCLITINQDDFCLARNKFNKCQLFKLDGIGIDLDKFHQITQWEVRQLRSQYKYNSNNFLILYVAEFIHRKNHRYLLYQIPKLKQIIPRLKVLLAGKGELFEEIKYLAKKLDIVETVDFLGYRNDIDRLYQIADIHVAVSKQEGLAVNNLEAMASGLPIVCSKIRGQSDVVIDGRNGFLFELNDPSTMINAIIKLYEDQQLRKKISRQNILDAKKFSVDIAVLEMAKIYMKYMPSHNILNCAYNTLSG